MSVQRRLGDVMPVDRGEPVTAEATVELPKKPRGPSPEARLKALEKGRAVRKQNLEKRQAEKLAAQTVVKEDLKQQAVTEADRRAAEAAELRRQFEELKRKMEETRGAAYDVELAVTPVKQRGRPRSSATTDEQREKWRAEKEVKKLKQLQEKQELIALREMKQRRLDEERLKAEAEAGERRATVPPAAVSTRPPSPAVPRPPVFQSPFMSLLAGRRRH